MYSVVDQLQGKAPVFQEAPEPPPPPVKFKTIRWCLWRCGVTLRNLFLWLRAAVLILLLTLGLPGFYLTLHLMLGPSLATLAARFQPAICTVAVSVVLEGKNKCTWSSCRQGCTTQELYVCWQALILVLNTSYGVDQTFPGYMTEDTAKVKPLIRSGERSETFPEMKVSDVVIPDEAVDESMTENDTDTVIDELYASEAAVEEVLPMEVIPRVGDFDQLQQAGLARLKINPQGCGYGSCQVWWRQYERVGTTFSCYVSADGSVAVPDVDYESVKLQAVLGALPLLLLAASCLLMYRLYWRKGATDRTLRLAPGPNVGKAKWEEARAQILVQRAMEQQNQPQKFDAELVLNVTNLNKEKAASRKAGVGSVQAWVDEEGKDSSRRKEHKRKLDLSRKWRQIAALATQHHPAVPPSRRFPEVTLQL